MVVGIKDTIKHLIISLMAGAAVFIATLFLNYNVDIANVESQVVGEQAMAFYEAQKLTSVVVCCASGGCLLITTIIMLAFFIKNYIDNHKKELGILKALGYSNFSIARSFWVFGINVLLGTTLGFAGAFAMMGKFYEVQNENGLLPDFSFSFHPELLFALVILPTIFFAAISIFYAAHKLQTPVLELIRDNISTVKKSKKQKKDSSAGTFLGNLKSATLRSRKSLIFFMFFGAFCFSAMTQMSFGTRDMASEMLSNMLLVIGLVVAFVTLFLAVSTVIKSSSKTTAMMKVFGYSDMTCRKAVLDGYRPVVYIGFAFGTFYQYLIMKLCVTIVFKNMEEIPEYNFDVKAMIISFIAFAIAYEIFMLFGLQRVKKTSIKEVMLES